METLIIVLVLVVIAYFIVKYKVSSSKPANERSAMEKIITSIGVSGKQNLEDVANSMRSPEISRAEGIQKCKGALAQLELDYGNELAALMKKRDDLSVKMEDLKKRPLALENKAKECKRKMENAIANGETELAEEYKKNAMMYLGMKKSAQDRIVSSEKFIKNIKITIEKSQIQYESRRANLEETLQEFETMHGAISTAKFNNSINMIKSLREETAEKLRAQNAEIEAANIIRNGSVSSEENTIAGDFTEEFDKL